MICKGFGGGWLPTSRAPFCKEHGPGQRVWAELVLQPSLPCARQCFGTGTTCRKSPSHSQDAAREQLGGKRNEAQVAKAKAQVAKAKSKAKNKCLFMHWAWPVSPIAWFFWLFSIFKRDCFPRRQTRSWLGCRSPCKAPGTGTHGSSSADNLYGPWDLTCWVYLGGEPKKAWCHPLLLSVRTEKIASGSHKNLWMQKCPQKPLPATCLPPRLLLADTYVASQGSVMVL